MSYDYREEINATIRKERALANRTKPITTARQWQGNSDGACEPMNSSFDTIFSAYHDYRISQQWN